eukprot:Tbor_TRINITY_DN5872_c1_g1::TRINITY_DN5872_c1_g1_i1::g.7248::m.7248
MESVKQDGNYNHLHFRQCHGDRNKVFTNIEKPGNIPEGEGNASAREITNNEKSKEGHSTRVPTDLPISEVSVLKNPVSGGKSAKVQRIWEEFLKKLEEDEMSFNDIKGYESRAVFLAEYGFNHREAAIIETRWLKESRERVLDYTPGDMPAVLAKQITDAEETKNFPYLATLMPIRKSIETMEKDIEMDPKRVKEILKESFHNKITACSIWAEDVLILQYLLSEDSNDPLRLATIILNRKTEKERVKYHNIRCFDKHLDFTRMGEEEKVLEKVEKPLIKEKFKEINVKLFDITQEMEELRRKGLEVDGLYDKVFLPKEKNIKGGEVLLPVRNDGVVDATCIENEIINIKNYMAEMGTYCQTLYTKVEEMRKKNQNLQPRQERMYQVGYYNNGTRGRGSWKPRGYFKQETYKGGEGEEIISNRKEN